MIAASSPVQRPPEARLLVVEAGGQMHHVRRTDILDHLRPGDLLVANDAATIPASLFGFHEASGEEIEIRLAGRGSLDFEDIREVVAVAFGRGDYHTPTEDRPLPPRLRAPRAPVRRGVGDRDWMISVGHRAEYAPPTCHAKLVWPRRNPSLAHFSLRIAPPAGTVNAPESGSRHLGCGGFGRAIGR